MKECDCDKKLPGIRMVKGNDLTVVALASVYDADSGAYIAFNLGACTGVTMRLVRSFNRIEAKTISVDGDEVTATFAGSTLSTGTYGVEILFTKDGQDGRLFERDLFAIVADSGDASIGTAAGGGDGQGYNITVDIKSRTLRVGQVSGITDYNLLENRPSVNGHTLEGDKTTEDLGLMPEGGAYTKEEADGIFQTKEKAAEDLQTVTEALDGKVEKEKGKGLSTNDYTDEDKAKVRKALQTESDPTVPDWAKAATKPAYTAKEVGAMPDTTKIPTKVSELENDKGFLTEHQSLEAYYQKAAAQLDNRVVAEAIVSLAARLDALEGSRGLLGDATAGTLDVRELTRCRYPLVMRGHGVPAEANVPDNLPDGLPWDGVPAFAGQHYINLDAASGGLYYAVGNENVSDWKQA